MENIQPPISGYPQKKRLLSLDVLRGITVVGMILVNNSGGKLSYDSLQHSAWNGLTLCDLVFPFFLFIMGISTYIALNKFHFQASGPVIRKILKRTLVICASAGPFIGFTLSVRAISFPLPISGLRGCCHVSLYVIVPFLS